LHLKHLIYLYDVMKRIDSWLENNTRLMLKFPYILFDIFIIKCLRLTVFKLANKKIASLCNYENYLCILLSKIARNVHTRNSWNFVPFVPSINWLVIPIFLHVMFTSWLCWWWCEIKTCSRELKNLNLRNSTIF